MAKTLGEIAIAGLVALFPVALAAAPAAAQDLKEVETSEPQPLVIQQGDSVTVEVYGGSEAQVVTAAEPGAGDADQGEVDAAGAENAEEAATEPNPDEMADMLNSRQQLQQTFKLKRTINGKVVETEERTVTYDRNTPYRETEAGRTTIEKLRSSFDGEALTRTEAFEEAKLDFVIADKNRDDLITAREFADLVQSWRNNDARQADAPNEEIARQRQYDAFLQEIDPATAEQRTEAYAREKFAFMAGASNVMSLQDYIREYLLDFDSMDENKDAVLRDNELMRFRALNRGETLNDGAGAEDSPPVDGGDLQ